MTNQQSQLHSILQQKLSTNELAVFNAKQGEKISKVNDLNLFCIELIGRAQVICGQNSQDNQELTAQQITVLTELLVDLLKSDYAFLTKKEIEIAFKNGAIGNYGEWYGINLKTFNFWLKLFINERANVSTRVELIENALPKPEITLPKLTDQEARHLWLVKESELKEYVETYGVLPQITLFWYDILDRIQMLSVTTERKWQLYNEKSKLLEQNIAAGKCNLPFGFKKEKFLKNECKLEILRDFLNFYFGINVNTAENEPPKV